MVGHAAEPMDSMAIALDGLLDQPIQVRPGLFLEENSLPPVPPEHHVIDAPGICNLGCLAMF